MVYFEGSFAGKAAAFQLSSLHEVLRAKGRIGSNVYLIDLIAESADEACKKFVDVIGALEAVKSAYS